MSEVFDQLSTAFAAGGITSALDAAEARFREEHRFHELFEILKMKSRVELGLPLMHEDQEAIDDVQQRALEEALLEACRVVGYALLDQEQIQDAWFYLRHLGENDQVAAALNQVEVSDENLEQLLGVLLHEGLDAERGYQLVLQYHGTCNAITTMQNTLYGRSKKERQAAGRLLVAHVHEELLENVKSHVEREEGSAPSEHRLEQIIQGRDFLFADGAYHMDTSHLSSTVQIAAELTDKASLELALDLTRYGARLDAALQYPSEAPFEDTYPAHGRLFAAQLGQDVDEAVRFFQQKAETTDAYQQGTFAIEAYIDLLARLGRAQEAMDATIQLIPEGIQLTGRAPSLYELSEQLGDFRKYRDICEQRKDALGYLISLGR